MIILYCNGRTYRWIDPYYIADRLGPSDCEWIVPGTHGQELNMDIVERLEIERRIAELDAKIANPHWGAALTAMDEERRSLKQRLGDQQQTECQDDGNGPG